MAAAVGQALARDDTKARLLKLALYPGYLGPEEFAAKRKQDQAAVKPVLTNIRMLKK